MIVDCKLRVRVKNGTVFKNNLIEKGWKQINENCFTKTFGTDTQAEIHEKILPFSGQIYYSVYIKDPETLTKHLLYSIADELEEMEQIC
ncbi:MAG: hypothetical protein GX088_06205 [Clostridia bacterium]|nr:hypothetical protein [Clostridia bacterium]